MVVSIGSLRLISPTFFSINFVVKWIKCARFLPSLSNFQTTNVSPSRRFRIISSRTWIELEMSSRKSTALRRIDELLDRLSPDDVVIASELSRLGRSIKVPLNTIETIVQDKLSRLILIKQNLDLNPNAKNNVVNKVLITIFSMLAELERDFISERTKEGVRARAAKGIKLGKPKGVIQASMYDKDREKIFHLYQLGVPIQKISAMAMENIYHLKRLLTN